MLKKVASNTIFQVLSKVVTAIIALFFIKILTNYFPKDLYGLYGIIVDYTGIFVFLADLGLYTIAIREISKYPEKTAKIVGNVMSLRVLLGVGILFVSLVIAYFLEGYNSEIALYAIAISSIFTILQLINSSILALLQAQMKMEIPALTFIFGKIINLALVVLVVYYFYPQSVDDSGSYFAPFLWIFGVATIGVAVNTLLNYLYARKFVRFGFAFDVSYIQELFWKSLPFGIALFLSVLYFKVDTILLPILEGPEMGNVSVAYYKPPMKITEVIMVLAGFFMSALLPSLSELYKKKKTSEFANLLSLAFQVLFSFSFFVFVIGLLFRENIIEVMTNASYLTNPNGFSSVDAFVIVFTVIVFYFISVVFIYALIASDNQKDLLYINIVVTIVNIVGNIIMIPKLSFVGAGIVTIISQMLLFVMTFIVARKKLGVVLPLGALVRNVFVGVVLLVLGYSILIHNSIGLYFDLFVYGGLLGLLYLGYIYYEYKLFRKKNLKLS